MTLTVPRVLLIVALAAVVIRAGLALALVPADGLRRQEPSVIAANINAGRGFVMEQYGAPYYALKEPGHIAFVALLVRWFGDRDAVFLVFQTLCGAGVAVAAALLARWLTGDALQAMLAGLLVAVNPFFVYYDLTVVHPLSLDTLLFVAVIAANVWAAEDAGGGFRSAALAGLATGAAIWQRLTLLFCGGAVWAASLVSARPARARQLGRAVLWAVLALAVIFPWFVRNHAVLGRWLFTTDIAHIMWLGNNPLSNGTYSNEKGIRVLWTTPAFRARIEGASELEQSRLFMEAVAVYVREQPLRAAIMPLRRVWYFVWLAPNAGAEYTPWQIRVYVSFYVVIVVLGVAGAVRFARRADAVHRRRAALVCASLAGLVAVHAATAINMKHRVPLDVLLSVFAGGTLAAAIRARASSRS